MRYFQYIFCLFPLFSYAQTDFQLSLDSRSGYEYNAFNQAQPLSTTTTSSKKIQSGVFQQFGWISVLKKTVKAHQFSWVTKGKVDHFWQLPTANLQRWETGVGYQYQWDKKRQLKLNAKYLSYQTNRQDNGTAVLTIPAAYQRWTSRVTYQWQPFKRNKSRGYIEWTKRKYAATDNNQLSYWSYEANLQSTQRFKHKGKKSSYLNAVLNFQQRDYTNSVLENNWAADDFEEWEISEADEAVEEDWDNEADDPNTYRRWQYVNPSIDYVFYARPSLRLTLGMAYEYRKDVWEERFGYQQIKNFIALRWKKEQWIIHWKVSTTFRQFSNLYADTNEAFLLQHLYLRNNFSVAYQLTEAWTLSTNMNLRKRWRNQPENATNSYAPYLTGLASVGVKYQWKKEK